MANTSSSNKRNAAGNDHILTISPYWLPEQIFSDSVTAEGIQEITTRLGLQASDQNRGAEQGEISLSLISMFVSFAS